MSMTYPYPSHVFVPSFVTVKLRGKEMYGMWKTQMLCLLESHDMLGFINDKKIVSEEEKLEEDYKLWRRSDALVKGWIFGSLSEQEAMTVFNCLTSKHSDLTAKIIWDQLEAMYAQQKAEIAGGSSEEDLYTKVSPEDLPNKVQQAKDRAEEEHKLYVAVESGRWRDVADLLQKNQVKITDRIGVNGNTALHIAVANSSTAILKEMLGELPDTIQLSDPELRNSDGSTLLHIAASVGNTDAAKVLVERSPGLLFVKDNEDCTPLDIVLSNPRSEDLCDYLLNETTKDLEQQDNTVAHYLKGEQPLVYAISCEDFKLAKTLLKRYHVLHSDAVLMAIAQNWHSHFNLYESIIYELFKTPALDFATRGSLDLSNWLRYHHKSFRYQDIIPFIHLFARVVFAWPCRVLIRIMMKTKVIKKEFIERIERREDAKSLLDDVCALIKHSNNRGCYHKFYSKPIIEAVRLDACGVVEQIVTWFPDAIMCVDEDGHNIAQAAWKNRAIDIFALLVKTEMAKHTNLSQENKNDPDGNNFLHYAARLAPPATLNRISGPTFKLQRELRWFKAAQAQVRLGMKKKNFLGETPEMTFTREHKDLVTECTEWMKNTANAYIITAILIITIVFAAAITVPGGNNDEKKEQKYGAPKFVKDPAFIVFMVSIAFSMMTATTSLLFFLAVLTSRFAEQDFFKKLPLTLMIGLLNLMLSATFMIISFGATLFLMFGHEYVWSVGLIAPLVAQPICVFIIYQSDLLADLSVSSWQFGTVYLYTRLKVLGRIFV